MAATKIPGELIQAGAINATSISDSSITPDKLHTSVAQEGLHSNSSGIRVLANNGLLSNSSGTFVVSGTGVTSNATGVHIGQAVATTSDVTFANVTQTASIIGTHAITSNTTHLLVGSTKIDAVDTAIANLVASAPGTLDTLNEIATALGSDPDLANTLTTSIATKMPIAGGTFTGAVTGTSFTAPSGFLGGVEGGIRIHSTGTKFFNIYANNTARDATMDIGASDARFKDLHISANAYIGGGIIDYGSSGTLKLQENGSIAVKISPRNVILNDYATLGRVKSGADTLLGHNVYVDGANNSTILQTNSSYYGAWIRMYYNEGISFGTVTNSGTADDTVWTRADESNEKMRLDNAGNLGIGTLDPVYKLDVVGASGTDVVQSLRNPSTSWSEYALSRYGTEGVNFRYMDFGYYRGATEATRGLVVKSQANATLVTFLDSGNVGIGDISPDFKLAIRTPAIQSGSTYAWPLDLSRPDTDSRGLHFGIGQSGDHVIAAHNADVGIGHTFGLDSNGLPQYYETLRVQHIDQAVGRVGIANTNPQSLLHLHGETNSWTTSPTILFTSSGTATNVRNWRIGPADTNYGNFHIAKSASQGGTPATTAEGSVFTIDYQGNVGIGTVSPDKKLTVSANTNPAIKLNDEDSSKYWYKQLESDGVVRTYMNTILIKEEFPNGEVVRRSAENFNLGGWDWRNSLLLHGNTMDGYSYPTGTFSPSDPIGPYINGYKVWYPDVNIRFNQNAIYTCSLTVFQVNDGGGVGVFYGGFICKDKSFNTLQVDGIGTYQYIMGSSQVHTTGNRYTYTVTVQGTAGSGVSNYTKVDAGTVWLAPMMLINYSASSGQQTVIENFTVSARGV